MSAENPNQEKLLDVRPNVDEQIAAMIEASRTRTRVEAVDPELAEIQARNLENGSGFTPLSAEKKVAQFDPDDVASEGKKRSAQLARQRHQSHKAISKPEVPSSEKPETIVLNDPKAIGSNEPATQEQIAATEVALAGLHAKAVASRPRNVTSESAEAAYEAEFGDMKVRH